MNYGEFINTVMSFQTFKLSVENFNDGFKKIHLFACVLFLSFKMCGANCPKDTAIFPNFLYDTHTHTLCSLLTFRYFSFFSYFYSQLHNWPKYLLSVLFGLFPLCSHHTSSRTFVFLFLLPSIEVSFRAQKKTPISSHIPSPRHATRKQKRWCGWGLEGSALIVLEMYVADKQTIFFSKDLINRSSTPSRT